MLLLNLTCSRLTSASSLSTAAVSSRFVTTLLIVWKMCELCDCTRGPGLCCCSATDLPA